MLGNVGAALGALVGGRLLTEFATPELFGEYKLALAGISLVSGIAIRPVIQFGMRQFHDEDALGRAGSFVLGFDARVFQVLAAVGATMTLLAFVPAQWLGMGIWSTWALAVLVGVLTSSLELTRAWAVTTNHQARAGWISAARSWGTPLLAALGTWVVGQDVRILLAATIAIPLAIELSQVPFRRRLYRLGSPANIDFRRMGTSFRSYASPLLVVGVFSWAVHESDRVLLSYLHSDAAVGLYSAAYGAVAAPFTIGLGALAQFAYPILFRGSDGRHGSHRALQGLLLVAGGAGCLGVLIVSIFSEQLARFALGPEFRSASGLMVWIAVGYACYAMGTMFDLVAYERRTTVDILWANGFAAALNVLLNWLLIPSEGARGAAMATCFSLVLYLVVIAVRYHRATRELAPAEAA